MRPSQRLLALFAAVLALSVAAVIIGMMHPDTARWLNRGIGAIGLFLGLLALLDALLLPKPPKVQWQRHLPSPFIQGREHTVELTFAAPNLGVWRRPQRLQVADYAPPDWDTDTPILQLDTLPNRQSIIRYRITPRRRGIATFRGIEYWLGSNWGLWQKRHYQPIENKVEILPDFSRILGADLLGLQRWLNLVGVKKLPRRGLGQDFHQLRDYQDGDDIRNIDWKATSRMSRPIVRTYQDEQDQQVLFLLDCGRNMNLQMQGKSHFDHALQAMLLLSYTALKHGDAVGLLTFAHRESRFVPPHKGVAQLGRLVRGVFDIEPSQQAPDLESAINLLLQKQKRRALIIVLSHFNSDDNRSQLEQIQRLRKHHMVLFGALKPEEGKLIVQTPITDANSAAAYLGSWQYDRQSAQAARHFDAARITTLHTLPTEMSTQLINHYLLLKRRQAW